MVRPSVWVWTGNLVGHLSRTMPVSADGDGVGVELWKAAKVGCYRIAPRSPVCKGTLFFKTGT